MVVDDAADDEIVVKMPAVKNDEEEEEWDEEDSEEEEDSVEPSEEEEGEDEKGVEWASSLWIKLQRKDWTIGINRCLRVVWNYWLMRRICGVKYNKYQPIYCFRSIKTHPNGKDLFCFY